MLSSSATLHLLLTGSLIVIIQLFDYVLCDCLMTSNVAFAVISAVTRAAITV